MFQTSPSWMQHLKDFLSNRQNAIDLCAGLLALCLPISKAFPNLLLIPLIILVIFHFKKINIINSPAFALYTLSILAMVSIAAINGTFLEDLSLFSRFLMVILMFFLFSQIRNLKLVEQLFLVGVFIAFIGSAIAVITYSYQNPDFLLGNGSIVNELLWLERPYFGIILSVGTFICLKNAEKYKKNDYYIVALLLIGFSIYISARLSILLNILLILIFLLKSAQIHRGTKIGVGFIFAILVAMVFGLSDNLMARMKITNDWEHSADVIRDYEPRFVIWPCTVEIIQNDISLLTGLQGYEKAEEKLTDCYAATIEKEDKRNYYLESKFNTHNQFLDFLLVGGIIPVILLLCMFFQVWLTRKSSFELKIILLMFFSFFLVENVLHRQLGCYLFGVFVALYSRRRDE